ncbi:MAG: 30S ribosome-binding factor RbfA [Treponema sp.]|mgnify:CR=1 FL=1|uniref:30S ribosome-binding factor RbfA n=1 Tax=Treponema sp. TaxID=166 RepID=UPI001B72B7E4|nr:30S ribosome-binding factor RbfA [Treponema sp.]MBP5587751.1 30S ribosome-binding factor RbfA [Treponema sp.]MBR0154571.1 30S ribosome-binding factor RbfA [Treponema sp.]MCR5386152.1 30S ribosome-binding factor RbfA [Treponema sp.]
MGEYRLLRLGEQIRSEIANMILRGEVKDPRVNQFLTINRVEVVSDLAYAKVFVSTFMTDQQLGKGVQGLQSAAGFIQSTIAKKLRIRQFPKLTFVADTSLKDGFNMVKKLDELASHDAEVARKAAESGYKSENTAE